MDEVWRKIRGSLVPAVPPAEKPRAGADDFWRRIQEAAASGDAAPRADGKQQQGGGREKGVAGRRHDEGAPGETSADVAGTEEPQPQAKVGGVCRGCGAASRKGGLKGRGFKGKQVRWIRRRGVGVPEVVGQPGRDGGGLGGAESPFIV